MSGTISFSTNRAPGTFRRSWNGMRWIKTLVDSRNAISKRRVKSIKLRRWRHHWSIGPSWIVRRIVEPTVCGGYVRWGAR